MTEKITWKNGATIDGFPEQAELGCWIDGHWGQYGPDRLVQIAMIEGWTIPEDDLPGKLAADFACDRASLGMSAEVPAGHDEGDLLDIRHELAEEAEQWLNDQLPEGYQFGWYDGEFFLQSNEWWEENDG